jgi:lipopolysaccharide biosynthesis regulator YciM
MTIDWIWLLLALPAAFGLGWIGSRLDVWHWKLEARHEPRAYFQGLGHLLNGQQDAAVDSFIEAVQNDPDTSELHFTLGSLFRKRGEYGRAVRVHEHLLARADLSDTDRGRAQLALAQDYWRAGILDRAETALTSADLAIQNTKEAQQLLLAICERGRNWSGASSAAARLQSLGAGHFDKRRAHYLCEQQQYAEAIALSPESPRAYLALSVQLQTTDKAHLNFDLLQTAIKNAPQAAPLLAAPWLAAAHSDVQKTLASASLLSIYAETFSFDVLQALVNYGALQAQSAWEGHLAKKPSLLAAGQLNIEPKLQAALSKATEPLSRFRCGACGFAAQQYFWHCPGCLAWDSYAFNRVEEL